MCVALASTFSVLLFLLIYFCCTSAFILAILAKRRQKDENERSSDQDKFEPMLKPEEESPILAPIALDQAGESRTDEVLEARIAQIRKEIESLKQSNAKLEEEREYLRNLSLQ